MRREEAWRDIPVIIVTAKDLTREEVDRLNGQRGQGVAEGAPTSAATWSTTSRPCLRGRGASRAAARASAEPVGEVRMRGERHAQDSCYVEDNEMNRDMLSRRLQRRGYEVLIAVDGEQGIAQASGAPARSDPDGHEPAGGRRLGGHAAAEGGARDRGHPDHRPDRARDVDRPGQMPGGGLRRLRHQAGRDRAPAREDRAPARRRRAP